MRSTERQPAAHVPWPDGKPFAFTVFDDPDAQATEDGKRLYGFLSDLGFRTTRGVWPAAAVRSPNSPGETCAEPSYRSHNVALQALGFEVGFHNATCHTSTRRETIEGLDRFVDYFGHNPSAMANHYNAEAIYWGDARTTPPVRTLYTVTTLGRTRGAHFGQVEGHPCFWGDVCRSRIRYCRNFVYSDINTLAACPWMPYHDAMRPWVGEWYASTDGNNVDRFVEAISEANQDRLEASGGACIMYAHFGHGFVHQGAIEPRFKRLMTRLSRKNGWFVPVSPLLDHVAANNGRHGITDAQRGSLERRWLWEKLFRGTS